MNSSTKSLLQASSAVLFLPSVSHTLSSNVGTNRAHEIPLSGKYSDSGSAIPKPYKVNPILSASAKPETIKSCSDRELQDAVASLMQCPFDFDALDKEIRSTIKFKPASQKHIQSLFDATTTPIPDKEITGGNICLLCLKPLKRIFRAADNCKLNMCSHVYHAACIKKQLTSIAQTTEGPSCKQCTKVYSKNPSLTPKGSMSAFCKSGDSHIKCKYVWPQPADSGLAETVEFVLHNSSLGHRVLRLLMELFSRGETATVEYDKARKLNHRHFLVPLALTPEDLTKKYYEEVIAAVRPQNLKVEESNPPKSNASISNKKVSPMAPLSSLI